MANVENTVAIRDRLNSSMIEAIAHLEFQLLESLQLRLM
jgi:hypothetical protein